jgi:transposase
MTKQHSNDFKLSAINLYLNNYSVRKVSKLLNCSKTTIHRWILRYFETGNVERKNYNNRNTIVTNNLLDYINNLVKINPSITLSKIKKKINKKYKKDISISYLFYIIKYKLNLTHKQLRRKYYPEKKLQTFKEDKKEFYKKIIKEGKRNIISIDETGLYLNIIKNNGRCEKGKRCYKTINKYPFVKFNFICAIKYGKIIGYKLYEKNSGGIDSIKFNNFYNEFIKDKYKNHLIILDNAKFHKSKDVIYNFENTGNKIIYSLPYNPNLNPIENFFSQMKNHVKNKSPDNFEDLRKTIKTIFENKITKEHIKNYFKYLYIQADNFLKKYP